jgi:hypothetical protein
MASPSTLVISPRNTARTADVLIIGHSYPLRHVEGRLAGVISDHYRKVAPPNINHTCPLFSWSGVNGETLSQTTTRLPTALAALTGGVSAMIYGQNGVNDIIAGTSNPTALINSTVTAFQTAVAAGQIPSMGAIGWESPFVSTSNSSFLPTYAAAIAAACAANGMVYIGVYEQYQAYIAAGGSVIAGDNLHPNTTGSDPIGQWTYGGFLLPFISYY